MDLRERFSSPSEAIQASTRNIQSQIWTSLPGIIVSYDATKNTVTVQPAVQGWRRKQDRSVAYENLPVIPDVPVMFPRGGGYTMTFPIQAGDECEIRFQSRNIDGWWDQGDVQKPLDRRMHDLSDAMVFLGPMSQKHKIDNISTTTMQIRSDDEKLLIEQDGAGQKITIKSEDVVVAINKATGKITLTAPTEITLTAPVVKIDGELRVTGEVVGKIDGDNIHLTTHRHGGVQSGGGQTNEPVDGT